jgi:multiple sugar transport system substrate-binding protein
MNKYLLPVSIAVAVLFLVISLILSNRLVVGSEENDGVVRVYYADNISAAHQKVIDQFNALHRGHIEVVPVSLPFAKFSTNERKELLARSLRNKSDRLDIFTVDHIWVPRFSRWCEPLDAHVPDSERRQMLPPAVTSCLFDSSLMALPMYIDVGLLYYRKDLVRKLRPEPGFEERLRKSLTWEEFRKLGSDRVGSGEPFYFFQANDYEGLTCNFFELIAGQDDKFFLQRPLDFERPEAHRALEMLVDFVRRDRISPAAVVEYDEIQSYTQMLNENGVFVRGWPNFIESYRLTYPDQGKIDQLDRAPLPHFEGRKPVAVFGGWNLMVSRYSTRKQEAIEFARFFQREDVQKTMFEIGGYIPTNLQVFADTAYIARHPVLAYYITLIKSGFHRPALVEYTKMSDIISRAVHRAVKGELDIDQALHEASVKIRDAGATR